MRDSNERFVSCLSSKSHRIFDERLCCSVFKQVMNTQLINTITSTRDDVYFVYNEDGCFVLHAIIYASSLINFGLNNNTL